jgi:hypothetical protein
LMRERERERDAGEPAAAVGEAGGDTRAVAVGEPGAVDGDGSVGAVVSDGVRNSIRPSAFFLLPAF